MNLMGKEWHIFQWIEAFELRVYIIRRNLWVSKNKTQPPKLKRRGSDRISTSFWGVSKEVALLIQEVNKESRFLKSGKRGNLSVGVTEEIKI